MSGVKTWFTRRPGVKVKRTLMGSPWSLLFRSSTASRTVVSQLEKLSSKTNRNETRERNLFISNASVRKIFVIRVLFRNPK